MSPSQTPRVSVVAATHDRPQRLVALLDSLRRQTLRAEDFEVVIVDDASGPETAKALAVAGHGLTLTTLRRDRSGGPSAARNEGWRVARAPIVAFTDDDCEAAPDWLENGLRACERRPATVVQGRTDPIAREQADQTPFTRTIRVHRLGPYYQTCNIFYPRELLERLGGFDERYTRPVGEDTDLAWRAIEAGAPTCFEPDVQVFHAVNDLGPVGALRLALKWEDALWLFPRHPGMRRAHLYRGVFWNGWHYQLLRAALALVLPRRLRVLRWWLASPYVRALVRRGPQAGGSRWLAPWFLLHDLVELVAVLRGAVRHRVLVL